jgi:hypothetical protein
MLVHYSHGSIQPLRMDNRENEFDSGIRVTCAYHLVPCAVTKNLNSTVDPKPSTPVAQLQYSITGSESEKDKDKEKEKQDKGIPLGAEKCSRDDSKQSEGMKSIDVEHDQ